jgi:hypothetical protein
MRVDRARACAWLAVWLAAALPACTASPADSSAREWQRSECNRILNDQDRERCVRRVEAEYGRR